jgi:2-aminoadipate transaminase
MKTIVWLRYFSGLALGLKPSIIRELLKAIGRPGVISFAGGLPAPEMFPGEELSESFHRVLTSDPTALQYGPTEGYPPLKAELIKLLARKGIEVGEENIIFTSGAQQALQLLTHLLIDRHDPIMVEEATYAGALQAFALQSPEFLVAPQDETGSIDMELLHRRIHYQGGRPKFLYLVPTFSNPTGITMALESRRRLVELASHHRFIVLEDDPYYDLRYSGTPLPPLKSFPDSDAVIHVGSFSKILAPGLRLGYAVASADLIRQLILLKQAVDMETSGLVQRAVADFLGRGCLEPHLERLRRTYGERCRAMIDALREFMPEETSWTEPEGGMFLWVRMPEGFDTEELLPAALEADVAYIPGYTFCPDRCAANALRLNFTNAEPELIREGIARLARVFKRALVRS